ARLPLERQREQAGIAAQLQLVEAQLPVIFALLREDRGAACCHREASQFPAVHHALDQEGDHCSLSRLPLAGGQSHLSGTQVTVPEPGLAALANRGRQFVGPDALLQNLRCRTRDFGIQPDVAKQWFCRDTTVQISFRFGHGWDLLSWFAASTEKWLAPQDTNDLRELAKWLARHVGWNGRS